MRPVQRLGGLVGVLLVAWQVQAQPLTYRFEERTITSPEVEVRSGPSLIPSYYPTSKLHHGDVVQVITNPPKPLPPGWLAIKPPPGSFSWVNAANVTLNGSNTGAVQVQDAPVLIGSALTNAPPSVRTFALERGTLLTILDKPLVASDGSRWLPIQPHVTEVRFVPADAVKPAGPVQTVASKAATAAAESPPLPAPGPSTGADVPDLQNPMLHQAEKAEKDGKLDEAMKLYDELAKQTTDGPLQLICLNRINAMKQRQSAPAAAGTGSPAAAAVDLSGRLIPTPANPPANQATAMYGNPSSPAASGPTLSPPAEQWSGPGRLLRAGFTLDGQPVYRLMNSQSQNLIYVTAQPGLPLDQYVNHMVNLYGTVSYRGEMVRANFLAARYVKLVP